MTETPSAGGDSADHGSGHGLSRRALLALSAKASAAGLLGGVFFATGGADRASATEPTAGPADAGGAGDLSGKVVKIIGLNGGVASVGVITDESGTTREEAMCPLAGYPKGWQHEIGDLAVLLDDRDPGQLEVVPFVQLRSARAEELELIIQEPGRVATIGGQEVVAQAATVRDGQISEATECLYHRIPNLDGRPFPILAAQAV